METNQTEEWDVVKIALAAIVGVMILSLAVYVAYRSSQKKSGDLVLPGGVTYLGPTTTPEEPRPSKEPQPSPPDEGDESFKETEDGEWKMWKGTMYPYSFEYPGALRLASFLPDETESVGFAWGEALPHQNILLNIELIDKRDPILLKYSKLNYVRKWYEAFSGLKGVDDVQRFTNKEGLRGYKARYVNTQGGTPNLDIFFEVQGERNIMIHLANGALDPAVFDRIVDSVSWHPELNQTTNTPHPTVKKPSPSPARSPSPA